MEVNKNEIAELFSERIWKLKDKNRSGSNTFSCKKIIEKSSIPIVDNNHIDINYGEIVSIYFKEGKSLLTYSAKLSYEEFLLSLENFNYDKNNFNSINFIKTFKLILSKKEKDKELIKNKILDLEKKEKNTFKDLCSLLNENESENKKIRKEFEKKVLELEKKMFKKNKEKEQELLEKLENKRIWLKENINKEIKETNSSLDFCSLKKFIEKFIF